MFPIARRHFKLFSVHGDDVSFGVSGHRLLMQHLHLSFDDLILSLLIRPDQAINVPKDMWKIVQVEPKNIQTPVRMCRGVFPSLNGSQPMS